MNLSILFSLFLCFAASTSQADAVKAELKKLEGIWMEIAAEEKGEKVAEAVLKRDNITFVFKGDKWSVRKGEQIVNEAVIKIDPAKKPKTFDATATEGEDKGKTVFGIYEMTDDTLKISYIRGKKDGRPADFNDKTASVRTFKRAKLESATSPPSRGAEEKDPVQAELKKLDGAWKQIDALYQGERIPEQWSQRTPTVYYVFTRDKCVELHNDQVNGEITIKIDPTKNPKTLDVTGTEGKHKGKTVLCIYELTDDTLKIGFVPGSDRRPPDFSKPDSMTIFTFKRDK